MTKRDLELVQRLQSGLLTYEARHGSLPGIQDPLRREALIRQLVDSVRRIQYVSAIRTRPVSHRRRDPQDPIFDPIKAAADYSHRDDLDEACWLVFLSVHFGKHLRDGWKLVARVYGGDGAPWTWNRMSLDPKAFRTWLESAQASWRTEKTGLRFGNHRKRQSLDAKIKNGTGDALESYVRWVVPYGGHKRLFTEALARVGTSPSMQFGWLYDSMDAVASFGRLARFDYLTMLGKLGLAEIYPGTPYLANSSGPLLGARLLLMDGASGQTSVPHMERQLVELGADLGVGMQEIEDAICNWQKSPSKYKPFRG